MILMTASQLKMALKLLPKEVTSHTLREYFQLTQQSEFDKLGFHIQTAVKRGYLKRLRKEGALVIYENTQVE